MDTKQKNRPEALWVLGGVLILLRILYEFRSVPWIAGHLSLMVAVVLIYVPILHTRLRKIRLFSVQWDFPTLSRSLFLFLWSSLAIFPPFLLANHFYQNIFFNHHLATAGHVLSLPFVMSQLLLVAFPEEFFYRGYLQPFIATRYSKPVAPLAKLGLRVTWAVPITALLFAFSHSVITLRWWHFAIFFPGLVFGWLREKSGGLLAPILFHATSNIVVMGIGMMYR